MPEITDDIINAALSAYEYATSDAQPSWRGMRAALRRVAPLIAIQEGVNRDPDAALVHAYVAGITRERHRIETLLAAFPIDEISAPVPTTED